MKDILPNISGGNIYIYIYIYIPSNEKNFFLNLSNKMTYYLNTGLKRKYSFMGNANGCPLNDS